MKEHGGNRRGWMRHVIAYGVAMPWLLFAPCLLHAVTCPGDLARKEIEGVVYGDGLDGAVIDVLRRLEDPSARVDALGTPSTNLASYDVPFWIPGPIKTDLDTWYEFNCDDTGTPCPAPTGFDEVDDVLEEFTTFVDLSKSLAQQPMDETVSTMESWSRWFYDPSSQADYYDVLFRLILWITTGQRRQEWVAVHRKHHTFTDREGDPHSPRLLGLWRVQLLNVYYYMREARNPGPGSHLHALEGRRGMGENHGAL